LQAVASSIAVGKTGPLVLPNQGKLARIIGLAIALSDDENVSSESQSGNKEPASKSMPSSEKSDSSGTGFYVSSSGIVLTNAHVVEGCTLIDVGGHEAKILEVSNDFDLALLSSQIDENTPYATFSPSPAELNSDVTVVGYPLTGILGGLNVTRGAVSSLKGIGGDIANMQISAPVQPGNSGGPIVNEKGQVVGVVVSKLDAEKIADLVGDIPQNVNFGVRGEIAKLFLFQSGVEPEISTQLNKIESVELARLVATFTVFISCKH
jgi:serine protease Do